MGEKDMKQEIAGQKLQMRLLYQKKYEFERDTQLQQVNDTVQQLYQNQIQSIQSKLQLEQQSHLTQYLQHKSTQVEQNYTMKVKKLESEFEDNIKQIKTQYENRMRQDQIDSIQRINQIKSSINQKKQSILSHQIAENGNSNNNSLQDINKQNLDKNNTPIQTILQQLIYNFKLKQQDFKVSKSISKQLDQDINSLQLEKGYGNASNKLQFLVDLSQQKLITLTNYHNMLLLSNNKSNYHQNIQVYSQYKSNFKGNESGNNSNENSHSKKESQSHSNQYKESQNVSTNFDISNSSNKVNHNNNQNQKLRFQSQQSGQQQTEIKSNKQQAEQQNKGEQELEQEEENKYQGNEEEGQEQKSLRVIFPDDDSDEDRNSFQGNSNDLEQSSFNRDSSQNNNNHMNHPNNSRRPSDLQSQDVLFENPYLRNADNINNGNSKRKPNNKIINQGIQGQQYYYEDLNDGFHNNQSRPLDRQDLSQNSNFQGRNNQVNLLKLFVDEESLEIDELKKRLLEDKIWLKQIHQKLSQKKQEIRQKMNQQQYHQQANIQEISGELSELTEEFNEYVNITRYNQQNLINRENALSQIKTFAQSNSANSKQLQQSIDQYQQCVQQYIDIHENQEQLFTLSGLQQEDWNDQHQKENYHQRMNAEYEKSQQLKDLQKSNNQQLFSDELYNSQSQRITSKLNSYQEAGYNQFKLIIQDQSSFLKQIKQQLDSCTSPIGNQYNNRLNDNMNNYGLNQKIEAAKKLTKMIQNMQVINL